MLRLDKSIPSSKQPNFRLLLTISVSVRGCYTRKLAPARVHTGMTFWFRSHLHDDGSFHTSLILKPALHVEKNTRGIQNRKHCACATRSSPPANRKTDFTPKRVVGSRLHGTVAKFRTGVKFSLRYNNWGDITPEWLAPAWHFVVISCKQI